jgi:hypothetical protein
VGSVQFWRGPSFLAAAGQLHPSSVDCGTMHTSAHGELRTTRVEDELSDSGTPAAQAQCTGWVPETQTDLGVTAIGCSCEAARAERVVGNKVRKEPR